MNERMEWIEPEEAARERCEENQRELSKASRFVLRAGMILCIPAALAFLLLSTDLEDALRRSLSVLALPCLLFVRLSVEKILIDNSQGSCVLDQEAASVKLKRISHKYLWKYLRSFEITDHATLPGFRSLTIHYQRASHNLQLNFRAGQPNEAELSAFIEARIAEQTQQRLMRRVKM